jgi:hypothetical protein
MTKKRTNQEFIKGGDYMAYIAGAHAAREAVDAAADVVNDFTKVSKIVANLFEETRTMAHPSASLGAAEVVSAIMLLSCRGGRPPEQIAVLGAEIGRELLSKISEPGVTVDQSVQFMTAALSEVMDLPHKASALAGFSSFVGPAIFVFLGQAREGMEAKNAKP